MPPNSGEDKKKSSPHSVSISVRNFGFLVAKWVLLAKKTRRLDILCPLQCQTQEFRVHDKIDAYEQTQYLGYMTTDSRPPQNRRL